MKTAWYGLAGVYKYILFVCLPFITNTHIYIYIRQQLRYPREGLQFFAYIHGAIRIIQHLPVILTFKDLLPLLL